MGRLFLDANVLFAAAWRPKAALQRLWELDDAELLSSSYASLEARWNLDTPAQRGRLTRLLRQVRLVEPEHFTLPRGVRLPEKDLPIFLAAIDGGATHLLTGDWEHFGLYVRQRIGGVLILPPAEYPPLIPKKQVSWQNEIEPERGSPSDARNCAARCERPVSLLQSVTLNMAIRPLEAGTDSWSLGVHHGTANRKHFDAVVSSNAIKASYSSGRTEGYDAL
ncbi:MAG: hypothetical protein ACLQIB_04165 [Isosphaeraceae bacterium]